MSQLKLGAFSVSLAVKDIYASKAFYEKLGFVATAGNIDQKWLILKNESTVIGLFQGMIPKNTLTFNPGWNQDAQPLDNFTDVREIEKKLLAEGITLNDTAKGDAGPAYITLTDPDGNPVLIDQHR